MPQNTSVHNEMQKHHKSFRNDHKKQKEVPSDQKETQDEPIKMLNNFRNAQ